MTDAARYLRTLTEAEDRTASARWSEALALWQQVVDTNPVNGSHWDRLAEASYEAADYAGALSAYTRVETLGMWRRFSYSDSSSPGGVAYRIACCHVRLGDTDTAIAELDRALRLGFRYLERPRTDDAWEGLRADGHVRELLGLIDADGFSREAGWRTDLSFFAREVKRRAYAPWAELAEADFDAAVNYLANRLPGIADANILLELARLLRPLGDGHAFVRPSKDNEELNIAVPLKFYGFEDGLFVTATAPEHSRLLGAEVLEVGGHALDAVWATLDPIISRDNPQQVKRINAELLRWSPALHALELSSDPRSITMTVRIPDGTRSEISVGAVAMGSRDYPSADPPQKPLGPLLPGWRNLPETLSEPLPLYLRNCEVPYWFEFLREHALVYLQFNAVQDHPAESFAEFCDRLFGFVEHHEVDRLVLDLRWNGGGNTDLSQPLLHHLVACRKLNQRGALFVIIGRATFSAAHNTATAIEREMNPIFVGEPSGSRPNFIGETIPFELPYSRTIVNVSDLYWQTSWPGDDRTWIPPEIHAPPTFETYRHNRDPAMEAIFECVAHLPGS